MKRPLVAKSYLVTVPLAALALAYVIFVFLPRQENIAHTRSEIQSQRQFIATTQAIRPTILALEEELAETRRRADLWRSQVPDAAAMTRLQGEIQNAGQASGATITRFNPQPPVEYQAIRQVPVAVACSGSFDSILCLLGEIESLSATVWVDRLRIDAGGGVGENLKSEIDLGVFASKSKNSG